jgi:predicted porin
MKKSLIALAVFGAFATGAQAQTNVQIGGIFQVLAKNYKVSNVNVAGRPAGQSLKNEFRLDDDYGSRFWITGTEDLGGGLSALFYVQSRFNTDLGNTASNGLANGDTYVGLKSNSLGQVNFGRITLMDGQGASVEYGLNGMPAFSNGMHAGKTIFNFIGNQAIDNSRTNNVIFYKSPSLSGFSVGAAVSSASGATEGTAPTAGTANNDYSDGGKVFLVGNYANGPIYVNLAYLQTKTEGRNVGVAITPATADNEQIRLSAAYTFGFGLKVGAQFDRASLKDVGRTAAGVGGVDRSRSAWEIPVSYTFGPHTVQASYTRAGDFSGTADSGAKMWVVGYDLALSKRTNVGVFYSKVDNDANGNYQPFGSGSTNGTALLNGESASIFTLGLLHKF